MPVIAMIKCPVTTTPASGILRGPGDLGVSAVAFPLAGVLRLKAES